MKRGEVDVVVPDDVFIFIRWVEEPAWLRDHGVSLKDKRLTCFLFFFFGSGAVHVGTARILKRICPIMTMPWSLMGLHDEKQGFYLKSRRWLVLDNSSIRDQNAKYEGSEDAVFSGLTH